MRQELISKINQLKKERNAVIVAHSYINDEIQGMADIVGDSYALSKYCAEQKDADVIVFCGVHFMAESAKILSPEKTVLLPEINAGCPMADMVTKEALIERKKQLPDAAVVCYINTSASVKAECDVCCTSSNAINIVSKIENDRILFVPDKNLARNVAVHLPQKQIIPWEGYCPAHNDVKPENIIKSKERYPNAKILVHPECTYEVCALADFVGSTKEIIEFATESEDKEFVIVTEMGVMYSLRRDNPNKKFYFPEEQILCENMKITTPESVYRALKENKYEIQLDKVTIEKARNCLEKMLELGK